jgi:hypothetical protein
MSVEYPDGVEIDNQGQIVKVLNYDSDLDDENVTELEQHEFQKLSEAEQEAYLRERECRTELQGEKDYELNDFVVSKTVVTDTDYTPKEHKEEESEEESEDEVEDDEDEDEVEDDGDEVEDDEDEVEVDEDEVEVEVDDDDDDDDEEEVEDEVEEKGKEGKVVIPESTFPRKRKMCDQQPTPVTKRPKL